MSAWRSAPSVPWRRWYSTCLPRRPLHPRRGSRDRAVRSCHAGSRSSGEVTESGDTVGEGSSGSRKMEQPEELSTVASRPPDAPPGTTLRLLVTEGGEAGKAFVL